MALMSRIGRVSGRRLLDLSRPQGEISSGRDNSKGWTGGLNFSDETTYLGSEGSGPVTVVVSRNGRVSGQGLRESAGPTAETPVGETTPKGGPSAPPSQCQPSRRDVVEAPLLERCFSTPQTFTFKIHSAYSSPKPKFIPLTARGRKQR
jgi:hypothetical protein